MGNGPAQLYHKDPFLEGAPPVFKFFFFPNRADLNGLKVPDERNVKGVLNEEERLV